MNAAQAKAHFSWRRIGLVAGIALMVIVFFVALVVYFNPIAVQHRRSHDFFARVKKRIDPEELRLWAANLASKYGLETKPATTELPRNLLELSPKISSVLICSTNDNVEQPHVMLIYGGGFYHWGMDIGPTNFVRQDDPRFTAIQWVPGIYFRHEGKDW